MHISNPISFISITWMDFSDSRLPSMLLLCFVEKTKYHQCMIGSITIDSETETVLEGLISRNFPRFCAHQKSSWFNSIYMLQVHQRWRFGSDGWWAYSRERCKRQRIRPQTRPSPWNGPHSCSFRCSTHPERLRNWHQYQSLSSCSPKCSHSERRTIRNPFQSRLPQKLGWTTFYLPFTIQPCIFFFDWISSITSNHRTWRSCTFSFNSNLLLPCRVSSQLRLCSYDVPAATATATGVAGSAASQGHGGWAWAWWWGAPVRGLLPLENNYKLPQLRNL